MKWETAVTPSTTAVKGKRKNQPPAAACGQDIEYSIILPMPTPILATKLFIPPPRPKIVLRPRLIEQLNERRHHKLTLISAPAGFGKTTLISEWVNLQDDVAGLNPAQVAWLSLDEGDSDPHRFFTYMVAALQTIVPGLGDGVMAALQSPQSPAIESILTVLLNELTAVATPILLILDDYHRIDASSVDDALAFFLDHLPPHIHIVITTREDPSLPLARYRVQGQLSELRATDLRFTRDEAAAFLNQVMGLALSAADIVALESRTEGWIAGLQMAALALQGANSPQGNRDTAGFIQSFSGSHRFVLDYLVEEVLHQQPENVQTFLLRTSILDRLCGPLCEAVLHDPAVSGQETLAYLERANLFLVPLDNKRRWYRYHHLFADLLQQRLQQTFSASATGVAGEIAELHLRASFWYEENDLEVEAFQHAAAAHDVERAERLMEGRGMPLLFRGAVAPVMNWLASLPTAVLNASPSLWVTYASGYLFLGQINGIEEKLQAAEAAMQNAEPDEKTRDLIGRIASMRATVAVAQNQVETIQTQSQRALAYLHPNNLPVRISIIWNMGYAAELQGDRAAAKRAYTEARSASQAIGHFIIHIMSSLGVGNIQEGENQLHLAAETYQNVLQLAGEPPLAVACAAHLGLARIQYEWNNLDAAHQHAQQSLQLARQFHNSVDRTVSSEVFLARLKLTQGDTAGAHAILVRASDAVRQHHYTYRAAEVAAAQVLTWLRQDNLAAATELAAEYDLPMSLARVCLAQGDPSQALAILANWRQSVEAKGWADEQLRALVLQVVAYKAQGDGETAVTLLAEALTLAEPEGFVRLFVDEGPPIADLLAAMANELPPQHTGSAAYIHHLLAAFGRQTDHQPAKPTSHLLPEPLSQRELEVLQLIADGLSNREISEQLFLALNTVKGHNRRIFEKLAVQRRTEAVARARELGLV